jgi:hypothetical protein
VLYSPPAVTIAFALLELIIVTLILISITIHPLVDYVFCVEEIHDSPPCFSHVVMKMHIIRFSNVVFNFEKVVAGLRFILNQIFYTFVLHAQH